MSIPPPRTRTCVAHRIHKSSYNPIRETVAGKCDSNPFIVPALPFHLPFSQFTLAINQPWDGRKTRHLPGNTSHTRPHTSRKCPFEVVEVQTGIDLGSSSSSSPSRFVGSLGLSSSSCLLPKVTPICMNGYLFSHFSVIRFISQRELRSVRQTAKSQFAILSSLFLPFPRKHLSWGGGRERKVSP